MNLTQREIARKAGIASVAARQSPELTRDKARAIELHQAGQDTGAIGRALSRERTEIRRWLIAAGIYRTKGRGKAVAGRRRYDPVKLIVAEYANEIRLAAKMDTGRHWRNHEVTRRKAMDYYYADIEAGRARGRKAAKKRYDKRTPAETIRATLACRIYHAIKRSSKPARKTNRTMQLVGCNINALMAHIESRFTIGMTWANYGKWHIDHRIPCAVFDLSKPNQQRACFHFSNLQPLWATDNLRKSDKVIAQADLGI